MRLNKRPFAALIVAATVFTTVYAAAASLDVTASNLGAGTGDVATCDSDGVSTDYTVTYSATAAAYAIATVTVSGIATPDCDGRAVKVTLIGTGDASLAEKTATLSTPVDDPTEFDFSASNVDASDVLKLAVVIY